MISETINKFEKNPIFINKEYISKEEQASEKNISIEDNTNEK